MPVIGGLLLSIAIKIPELPKPVFVKVHVPEHELSSWPGSKSLGVPPHSVHPARQEHPIAFTFPLQVLTHWLLTLNLPPPKLGLRKMIVVSDVIVPMTSPFGFLRGCVSGAFFSTLSAFSRSFFSCSGLKSLSSSTVEELGEVFFDWHPTINAIRVTVTVSFKMLHNITVLPVFSGRLTAYLIYRRIRVSDKAD